MAYAGVDLAHLLEVEQDILGGIDRAVVVSRDDLDGGKEKGLGVVRVGHIITGSATSRDSAASKSPP